MLALLFLIQLSGRKYNTRTAVKYIYESTNGDTEKAAPCQA